MVIELLYHPVMIAASIVMTLIGSGIWFASICYVGSDSIYGHYPSKYGSRLIISIPLLVIWTFLSIAVTSIILSIIYLAAMVVWHMHLKRIRGPRHWYYNHTTPPPTPHTGDE